MEPRTSSSRNRSERGDGIVCLLRLAREAASYNLWDDHGMSLKLFAFEVSVKTRFAKQATPCVYDRAEEHKELLLSSLVVRRGAASGLTGGMHLSRFPKTTDAYPLCDLDAVNLTCIWSYLSTPDDKRDPIPVKSGTARVPENFDTHRHKVRRECLTFRRTANQFRIVMQYVVSLPTRTDQLSHSKACK